MITTRQNLSRTRLFTDLHCDKPDEFCSNYNNYKNNWFIPFTNFTAVDYQKYIIINSNDRLKDALQYYDMYENNKYIGKIFIIDKTNTILGFLIINKTE